MDNEKSELEVQKEITPEKEVNKISSNPDVIKSVCPICQKDDGTPFREQKVCNRCFVYY
jgi:hypothetical protein